MRPHAEIDVRVAVFGGLRIWRGAHEVNAGPTRQRILLAMLLAAAGGVVSMPAFVNALWPDDPPDSAVNQVQRLVGQVRRTLEPSLSPHATGRLVVAEGAGYRIAAESLGCDLFTFRELARRADESMNAGDSEKGRRLYVEALEQCRGVLFAGLDSVTVALPEIGALERERESVIVAAATVALEQSSLAPELVEAVRQAAARAPLNEAVHEVLLRVLAATGRRAEALTAYDTVRRHLADELGVDPGPQLAATFTRLLTDQPAGPSGRQDEPARLRTRSTTTALARPPAQLPRPPAGYVDRTTGPNLATTSPEAATGEVQILAVGGMAGVGKTAFAVKLAHQLAPQYPDGQLYLDLLGFSREGLALGPGDALARLLESLGERASTLADSDVASRSARFRSLIADRRMIVVLDNARDSAQVRPLLPGSSNSLVIVTSRSRLTSLVGHDGAQPLDLDRLSTADARALFTGRIGPTRAASDVGAVERIIDACGGLPLALSIVAGRISTEPMRPLAAYADELSEPGKRLDALTTGEPDDDVRALLSWSYRALSVDAARTLRHLAAHRGPDTSLPVLASINGLTARRTSQLVDELAAGRLVAETKSAAGQRRYVMHDLVREFASEQLDAAHESTTAAHRLVEHYVHTTRAAFNAFGRVAVGELPPVASRVKPEAFSDAAAALSWYAAERTASAAAVDIAIDHGLIGSAAHIVLDRRPMNHALDPLDESLPQSLRLVANVPDHFDPLLLAELHRDISTRYRQGPRSEQHRSRALMLFRQGGDIVGESNIHRNMMAEAMRRRDLPSGLRHAVEAHALAERSGQESLAVTTAMGVGGALVELGRFAESIEYTAPALRDSRRLRLDYLIPVTSANLALAYLHLGRQAEALTLATEALELLRKVPDVSVEFVVVSMAAQAALDTGDLPLARAMCDRFADLFDDGGRARIKAAGGEEHDLDSESRRVDRVRHDLDGSTAAV